MVRPRVGSIVGALRPAVWSLIAVLAAAPVIAQEEPGWSPEGGAEAAPGEPPGGLDGSPDGPPAPGDDAPPADGDWDQQPGAEAPDPDAYEPALRPYGTWGTDPQYGRFWRPSVAAGWQPYFDGRWGWSPWGWTWLSSEPWSWTYHYGRWSSLPQWGWVWFPGAAWSPAWVSWSWFGGYVGWAPLGYRGRPAYDQYVFVRTADFCAPYAGRRGVRWDRLPRGSLAHWRDHPGSPPPYSVIRRVGRYAPTMLGDRPSSSLSPWDLRAGPSILERGNSTHRGRRGAEPGYAPPRLGGPAAEGPRRVAPAGRAPRDRSPRMTERGGGRGSVAPGWRPRAPRPDARTTPGSWVRSPAGGSGRWRPGSPGGGQMPGTPTHPRAGDGPPGGALGTGAARPGAGVLGGMGGRGFRGGSGRGYGGYGGGGR
jgi:hypothetical protein